MDIYDKGDGSQYNNPACMFSIFSIWNYFVLSLTRYSLSDVSSAAASIMQSNPAYAITPSESGSLCSQQNYGASDLSTSNGGDFFYDPTIEGGPLCDQQNYGATNSSTSNGGYDTVPPEDDVPPYYVEMTHPQSGSVSHANTSV